MGDKNMRDTEKVWIGKRGWEWGKVGGKCRERGIQRCGGYRGLRGADG